MNKSRRAYGSAMERSNTNVKKERNGALATKIYRKERNESMLMLLLRRIRFANLNCTKQWTRRKVPCALPDSNPHSDTALQGALFQGGYLMYGITVQKNENVPETFRKRSGNVPGTFRERSRNRDNCTLAITVRDLASMIK